MAMKIYGLFIMAVLLLLAQISIAAAASPAESGSSQIANPASVYCTGQGYKLDLRDNAGYCVFPNGQECEEWAFYYGKCQKPVECISIPSCVQGTTASFAGYDSNGCKTFKCVRETECVTLPNCIIGTTPSFAGYDSNGCKTFTCVPTGDTKVEVSAYAEPSTVDLYSQFTVTAKVSYVSAPSSDTGAKEKKFKVVASYGDNGYSLGAAAKKAAGTISLSASDDVLQTLANVFSTKKAAISGGNGGAAEKAPTAEVSESATSIKINTAPAVASATDAAPVASVTSVAAIAVANPSLQERVDYVALSPGGSKSISASFTAKTSGGKKVSVKVYLLDSTGCKTGDGAVAINKAGACQTETLVGETSVPVTVSSGTQPPAPPQDDATGTIVFNPGWNMISMPVDAKVSMADVSAKCGTAAYAWKLTASGYVKVDALEPGYGYWVKGTQGCKYDVSAQSYSLSVAQLSSGWNLVGAPGREVAVSEYSGSCQITSGPWAYPASGSPYVYSSRLAPGKAYWVQVSSACGFSGASEEKPPAPPQ